MEYTLIKTVGEKPIKKIWTVYDRLVSENLGSLVIWKGSGYSFFQANFLPRAEKVLDLPITHVNFYGEYRYVVKMSSYSLDYSIQKLLTAGISVVVFDGKDLFRVDLERHENPQTWFSAFLESTSFYVSADFYALIMKAYLKADSVNRKILEKAYPALTTVNLDPVPTRADKISDKN